MNDYKIVFLDIDGTILTPDHSIEASTKDAISQLHAKGIEVVLATGRPLHNIRELANELAISSYITYNGAHCLYKGNEIFKEPIAHQVIEQFVQIASVQNHELVFYTNKENVFTSLDSDIVQQFIKTFSMEENRVYDPSIKEDVLGLTIITPQQDADAHYQSFDGIHYTRVNVEGLKTCFDVIRDRVNKGNTIQKLLTKLGYSKENAIAFGDGMNDKEMLMSVGEGFAMGNAHPDLVQYAKYQTTDVENGGIYNGLKQLGIIS